jgi:hypothetical protein
MNSETIRVWTDRPAPAVLLAALTAAIFTVAGADGARLQLAEVAVVAAVAVASLLLGAAGGLVAGVAGAAAHIALHSSAGSWGGQNITAAVVAVCAYIAYGWLCGLVGTSRRRSQSAATRQPAAAGAGGSQGLLTAAEARAFLALEGQRAGLPGEQVTILAVRATAKVGVPATSARLAFRAAARTLEASALAHMHPVLLEDNQLGMVMLGKETQDLRRFERTLVAAMGNASFADRAAGTRRRTSSILHLQSSYLALGTELSMAAALANPAVSRRRDAAVPAGARAQAA